MKLKLIAIATILATTLTSFANADSGQPVQNNVSGHHAGKFAHGHRHGDGIFGLEHVLTKLQPQLGLNSEQTALFQTAQGATASLKTAAKQAHQNLQGQIASEMANSPVNFGAISQDEQAAHQTVQTAAATARNAWLAAYAGLTPAQQTQVSTVVQAQFQKRKAQMEAWKAKRAAKSNN